MIIEGNKFTFVDTIETPIAVADSWVKPQNKIGSANGEAKLYVASREKMEFFFGGHGFAVSCFVLKKDLQAYMNAIKEEYFNPSQEYRSKEEMRALWYARMEKVNALHDLEVFTIREKVDLQGNRGYVNSIDKVYHLLREISLPLVSYISTMHLMHEGQPMFYWKLFADFDEMEKRKTFIENYGMSLKQEPAETSDIAREEAIPQLSVRYAREGQEGYRKKLLEECPFCPITMINEEALLIASHIKPWAVSDSFERTDPNNGFILSPLYDKLFDRGYITFNDDKRVLVSNWLSRQDRMRIGIADHQHLQFLPLNDARMKYLEYHRDMVFKG